MDRAPEEAVVALLVGGDGERLERTATAVERSRDEVVVETATSASEALDRLSGTQPVDCVVSESRLPGATWREFFESVRERAPDLPFVLFPADGSADLATDAVNAGATDYVHPGSGSDQYVVLADRIERAVADRDGRDRASDVAGSADSEGSGSDVAERNPPRDCERYERLVQLAGDGAYATDADGQYVMVNDRFVERTGYDRAELLGRSAKSLIGEADVQRVEGVIRDLLGDDDRDYAEFEVTVETAEAGEYPAEVRMAPLVVDGDFRGTVGLSRDIAERKRRERELRERTQALDRQNDRLERFVSVVSHDLRNPLNVATARLELAREECDSDHLDRVADAHDRMEQLIADLLALSRESSRVDDPAPMDLATVARETWRTVATDAARLRVDTNRQVLGDGRRMRQAFENLFRNAVEHSPSEVTVTVGDCRDGFYVADDGPGIPPEDRERVFEPGASTAEDGTGLGLLIVSEIAEAHDWDVAVTESDAGGARVEFTGVNVVTDGE